MANSEVELFKMQRELEELAARLDAGEVTREELAEYRRKYGENLEAAINQYTDKKLRVEVVDRIVRSNPDYKYPHTFRVILDPRIPFAKLDVQGRMIRIAIAGFVALALFFGLYRWYSQHGQTMMTLDAAAAASYYCEPAAETLEK